MSKTKNPLSLLKEEYRREKESPSETEAVGWWAQQDYKHMKHFHPQFTNPRKPTGSAWEMIINCGHTSQTCACSSYTVFTVCFFFSVDQVLPSAWNDLLELWGSTKYRKLKKNPNQTSTLQQ